MTLDEPSSFDWLELPSGRARFSGGIRGFDELGHETFAVEVDGREYFGEIGNIFLPNGNDYNMEVISFGYGRIGSVGIPMLGTCQIYLSRDRDNPQTDSSADSSRHAIRG